MYSWVSFVYRGGGTDQTFLVSDTELVDIADSLIDSLDITSEIEIETVNQLFELEHYDISEQLIDIENFHEIVESCDGVDIMSSIEIYQGDTPPARLAKFSTIDVSSTTCKQTVRASLEDTPIIDAAVTATLNSGGTDYFHVYLTDVQTAALPVGEYIWIIELYAAGETPALRREIHRKLTVNTQGA